MRASGMEFSRVVLFDVSDGSFPPAWAYKGLPGEEWADKDKQFRSLLYVAASRARRAGRHLEGRTERAAARGVRPRLQSTLEW